MNFSVGLTTVIFICRNSKIWLRRHYFFIVFLHQNLKTVWWVTDHSMCRCGSTPGSELWDYAGLQVHAGSWERWGHFPPPGCPGYEGKEEACLLPQLHTPQANHRNRNNQYIRFSEAFSNLKAMTCLHMFSNPQHFFVYLSVITVITYCLIFQFQMKHRLSFFVISGDLRGLPYILRIWDPDPSELKHKWIWINLITILNCYTVHAN